jgi:hypothetical protein
MPKPNQRYNLHVVNPDLSKEWNYAKNYNLTPKDVAPGSHKKAWWICGKGHEWIARIKARNAGQGCPYCAGKAVCDDNCLLTINPDLAAEWNYYRNGNLIPEDVTANSGRKAWWICTKGHEWRTRIADRNRGRGCPYCAGMKACEENCLQTTSPDLAKEWNCEKNHNLTPKDVTAGSNKVVWWTCENGHEWKAKINYRKQDTVCPYCKEQRKDAKSGNPSEL